MVPRICGGLLAELGDHEATAGIIPRMRGDHVVVVLPTPPLKGSSPHAWGPPGAPARERPRAGIIPTRVGTTSRSCRRTPRGGGHPHTRGDHKSATAGSSPPTRGPHQSAVICVAAVGIIPAYAGTTAPGRRIGAGCRDHPRLRGDHVWNIYSPGVYQGSSPPTRGPPRMPTIQTVKRRIIPAYAGTTRRRCKAWWTCRDHPRLRGDHKM